MGKVRISETKNSKSMRYKAEARELQKTIERLKEVALSLSEACLELTISVRPKS